MWIKCTNPATVAFHDKNIHDEKIYFSENGTVNVPKEVGEALVAKYESFEACKDMKDDESEDLVDDEDEE